MAGFEFELTLEELDAAVAALAEEGIDLSKDDIDASATAYIVKRKGLEEVDLVVGNMRAYSNTGDCPHLDTGRIYEDMFDAFIAGDRGEFVKKAELGFGYQMKLTGPILTEQSYILSEKVLEEAILEDVEIVNKLRDCVVVNPSSGTLHRMTKRGLSPQVMLFDDNPDDYNRRIKSKIADVKLDYFEADAYEFDDDTMYYFGTGIDNARKYSVKNYVGFELNPMVLASRGDVISINEKKNKYHLEYMRRNEKKELYRYYDPKRYIYGRDYMNYRYKTKVICHDLVLSFKISSEAMTGIMPGTTCLVGLSSAPKDALIEFCQEGHNNVCKEDGDVLWKYRYVRNRFYSSYIDLGEKFYYKKSDQGDVVIANRKCEVSEMKDCDFVMIKDPKGTVFDRGNYLSVYPRRPVSVTLRDMIDDCENYMGVNVDGEQCKLESDKMLRDKFLGTYYGDLEK